MNKIFPCVIGLGYVGLPVFLRLQNKFKSIGFDNDKLRIKNLSIGIDTNKEFKRNQLNLKNNSYLSYNQKKIKKSNFFIVTVPTPINNLNKPDLSHLINASMIIGKNLKKNDVIIYESTVYPGTTNYLIKNILNKYSNLREGIDYFVGYSPERVNPGDPKHTISNIKKILAFSGPKRIMVKTQYVYRQISKKLILTNSVEAAETAKVIENIQRDLNIAFINDILLFADQMNYNFNEIIRLASSKWNFLKFKPGLVGGHCLPVDPYYLNYVANLNKVKLKTLLAGRNVNDSMKKFVMKKVLKKISILKKADNKIKPKVLICGITYKKNVADIRNSLSLQIFLNLRKKYKNIYAYDYVCENKILKKYKIKKNLEINKDKYDIVVFLVDHKKNKSIYNYFKKQKKIIVDPFRLYFK
jgi:UDP-N-acetyl-D-galactosamine dehydrogenase